MSFLKSFAKSAKVHPLSPYLTLNNPYILIGDLMSSTEKKSKEKKPIQVGDWVRCLRNDVGAPSPHQTGHTMVTYESFMVSKIESRSSSNIVMTMFIMNKISGYLPLTDVEKIEECICAPPLLKSVGCRCGWKTMDDFNKKKGN